MIPVCPVCRKSTTIHHLKDGVSLLRIKDPVWYCESCSRFFEKPLFEYTDNDFNMRVQQKGFVGEKKDDQSKGLS